MTSSNHAKGSVEPLSTKQNMLWNSAGSVVNLGLQWLLTVFVVRLSTNYEAAGMLSLAMSVYNIFAPLAIYRMYTYQVSDVKRENSMGEYFAFRMVTCGGALLLIVVYTLLTCDFATWLTIGLYAAFKVVGLLIDVLHGEDQLNGRMDYIGKSLMLQGVSTFAAFCVVFWASQSLEAACTGMLAAAAVVGILYDLPRTRRFAALKVSISREKALQLLMYCLPITLATIACSAAPSIPKQYLAFTQGNELLGIYASVAAPAAVVQMGASYIYNPLLSLFAKHHLAKDTDAFRALFLKALLGITVLGIACAIGFELLAPWILPLLFGQSIAPYTYLMLPVIILAIETAYVWFVNDLLVALREFKGSFIGNVAALTVSVPATFPLVDAFSMNGINFTGMIAFGIGAVIMTAFLIPYLRRPRRAPQDPQAPSAG